MGAKGTRIVKREQKSKKKKQIKNEESHWIFEIE